MASCERVASAPTWRGLWKQVWRYILPALGFYEWQAITDSAGRAAKLPWYIRIGDQLVFGMAGLWDVSIKEDGTRVESCAVIAVPVHKVMDVIDGTVAKTAGSHDGRMPVILTRAAQEARVRITGRC